MAKIVFQAWWERDAWSGPSRAGYSLHTSLERRIQYIKNYWDGLPQAVPDSYDAPEGDPVWVEIPDHIYDMLRHDLNKAHGLRFYTDINSKQVPKMLNNSLRLMLIDKIREIEAEQL